MSTSAAGAHVLVADDEDGIRSTFADILRSQGYAVLEAEDGEQALDTLRAQPVDVVLLDVRMPKCTGIEVLEALEHPPVVLLVTAFDLEPQLQQLVRDKVFKFVRKPVPPPRLLQMVADALAAAGAGP